MKNLALRLDITRPKSSPAFSQLKGTATTMPTASRTARSSPKELRLQPTLFAEEQVAMDKQHHTGPHQHHAQLLNNPRFQDRAKTARRESLTLMEYSRRRFQTLIDTEPLPDPATPGPSPRHQGPQVHLDSRPRTTEAWTPREKTAAAAAVRMRRRKTPLTPTPTNGPTRDGSLLYNSKPFLLSSIRTRPKSETPGRFDHLRGSSLHHPDIQRRLEQSNSGYRVQTSPCRSTRPPHPEYPCSASPDFVILIPVTSQSSDVRPEEVEEEEEEVEVSGTSAEPKWAEKQILLASSPRSRSPKKSRPARKVKKSGEGRAVVEKGGKGRGAQDVSRKAQPPARPQPASVPRVNLTHTPAEGEVTAERATPVRPGPSSDEAAPAQPARPPALLTVPGAKKRQTSAKNRASSSRPSSSRSDASSVLSTTPRPRCWVDDISVSSEGSSKGRQRSPKRDLEGEVAEDDDNRSTKSPSPAQRGHSAAGEKKKKEQGANLGKRASPTVKRAPSAVRARQGARAGGKGPRRRRKEVVTGDTEEEEGEEMVLPRFLCPSSESKSRQAAIKEWLANTSFSSACRTVPLM